ncbi:hypothetical protein ABOUO_25 [Brevibacillus phage Abouo]|uniref:Uncharacterized protein n=2 Tax=Abouovirus TaxID=1984773 RepID=S5MUQ7_9CAUD|nr:hypothetical protein DAVIES_25 [Brevibacillus phage Davies]YP_009220082.1 hypothetical protein AVV45_gp25 [Brevibacillus phage Abouo]AGR47465.1 hypothetical protein ABOUO_25 [Brevibacillus phage Abouo]AGR47557.1 hypothetical protein DAVIES_25 [Brevibacillus phage Davies]
MRDHTFEYTYTDRQGKLIQKVITDELFTECFEEILYELKLKADKKEEIIIRTILEVGEDA